METASFSPRLEEIIKWYKMAILPVFAVVIADVSGAGCIFRVQLFLRLGLRQSSVAAEQARQPFAPGRVDENMESILALLENALASPPHNHTVANLRRLFNDPAGQMGRHFGIKPAGHGASDVTPQTRRLPEDLRQPIEPRVGALVEFFRHFGLNPGGFRDFFHQAAVEQFPSQAAGQQLGDPCAPASVLSRYGHDAEHGSSFRGSG